MYFSLKSTKMSLKSVVLVAYDKTWDVGVPIIAALVEVVDEVSDGYPS